MVNDFNLLVGCFEDLRRFSDISVISRPLVPQVKSLTTTPTLLPSLLNGDALRKCHVWAKQDANISKPNYCKPGLLKTSSNVYMR